ncbi:MAG: preprotein translocase subunit SecE [Candidatus Omnitrophota bacterium]
MNLLLKPVKFLKEVKVELGKVAWSTKQELIASTVVVIVVTALATLYIASIDLSLSKFLSLVFK